MCSTECDLLNVDCNLRGKCVNLIIEDTYRCDCDEGYDGNDCECEFIYVAYN